MVKSKLIATSYYFLVLSKVAYTDYNIMSQYLCSLEKWAVSSYTHEF